MQRVNRPAASAAATKKKEELQQQAKSKQAEARLCRALFAAIFLLPPFEPLTEVLSIAIPPWLFETIKNMHKNYDDGLHRHGTGHNAGPPWCWTLAAFLASLRKAMHFADLGVFDDWTSKTNEEQSRLCLLCMSIPSCKYTRAKIIIWLSAECEAIFKRIIVLIKILEYDFTLASPPSLEDARSSMPYYTSAEDHVLYDSLLGHRHKSITWSWIRSRVLRT